jgi:hypothetical protein
VGTRIEPWKPRGVRPIDNMDSHCLLHRTPLLGEPTSSLHQALVISTCYSGFLWLPMHPLHHQG